MRIPTSEDQFRSTGHSEPFGGRWKKLCRLQKMRLLAHANRILNRFGYKIENKGLGYLDPIKVVEEARSRNLTLCEYLERFNIGGVGRRRDAIISALQQYLPKQLDTVLEIGAGTGMYLEKVIDLYLPRTYQVYETAIDWAAYLEAKY